MTNRRVANLRNTYGISAEDYERMLESQGGRCAICETDTPVGPGGKYFMVDHCHNSGNVRGLLCGRCNFILGNAKDSVNTLLKAIEYLQKHDEAKK